MFRKTCPVCRAKWEKDPAKGLPFIYQMRVVDFVKGLGFEENNGVASTIFHSPTPDVDAIAQRMLDIADAMEILDAARERIAGALPSLATTPAVQALPAFIRDRANDIKEDGLESFPCYNSGRFRVWIQDGKLKFEEVENA